jgi:hypothetical protein
MSAPACVVGVAKGTRCLAVIPGEQYCKRHHPGAEHVAERKEQASLAAKASHMRRHSPEVARWIDSVRWDSPDDIRLALLELFKLGAQNGFTPAALNALGNLARTALATLELAAKVKPAEAPLTISVQRFSPEPEGSSE